MNIATLMVIYLIVCMQLASAHAAIAATTAASGQAPAKGPGGSNPAPHGLLLRNASDHKFVTITTTARYESWGECETMRLAALDADRHGDIKHSSCVPLPAGPRR